MFRNNKVGELFKIISQAFFYKKGFFSKTKLKTILANNGGNRKYSLSVLEMSLTLGTAL